MIEIAIGDGKATIAVGDLFSNGDRDQDRDLKFDQDRDRDRDRNFRDRGSYSSQMPELKEWKLKKKLLVTLIMNKLAYETYEKYLINSK